MAFENLSDREKNILANLIQHYIGSADPVGSRVIANKFHMGISPATVRNTLQDLEELGLVEQPHTSAGRIPTDMGYRVYVDYLLKPEQLTDDEKRLIKEGIVKEGLGIKEILGQTARLLGDITNQLGLTIGPRFEAGILKDLKLIPVTEGRLMMVIILESGLARSLILEVETDLADSALQEVEHSFNERLRGLTLSEICRTISERMVDVTGSARLLKVVVDSGDKIWTEDSTDDLLIAGKENLLRMPEFASREKLSALFKIFDDGRAISDLLAHIPDESLIITIGSETKINEIMNCSLITAPYRVGNVSGTVGIIGPTRMPYSKAVSIVEYTARSITDILTGKEKKTQS